MALMLGSFSRPSPPLTIVDFISDDEVKALEESLEDEYLNNL
jgi:hypothetical protein